MFFIFTGLIAGVNLTAQEAKFTELTGTVEYKETAAGEWRSAAVGGIIGKDMVISTGIRSTAVVSLGASTLTVRPMTILTLEELVQSDGTEEAVLFLRTGRVRADVTPPSGMKADFTVKSPTTTASVRGTSFEFDGRRLSVQSGRVRLSNRSGQKVNVRSGQRSYSDAGGQYRLVTPFEAEKTYLNPSLSDLTNTGSGGDPLIIEPGKQEVNITVGW